MRLILTTCCKVKNPHPELLPAIDRYISRRIASVYAISQKEMVPFAIFSGKFGLVFPESLIPYYDHLLTESDKEAMKKIVHSQLLKTQYKRITFYANSVEMDPSIRPYRDVIAEVCKDLGIELDTIGLASDC